MIDESQEIAVSHAKIFIDLCAMLDERYRIKNERQNSFINVR